MRLPRRTPRKHPAFMAREAHLRLWRIVEGALEDTFLAHPDYLTERGQECVLASATKRVVGQLVGHAKAPGEGRHARLDDGNACQAEPRVCNDAPPDRRDGHEPAAPAAGGKVSSRLSGAAGGVQ